MDKRRGPLTLLMTSPKFRRWVVAAVLVLLPFLYLGSFGPMCWKNAQPRDPWDEGLDSWMIAYWPLGWVAANSETVGPALEWWMTVGL